MWRVSKQDMTESAFINQLRKGIHNQQVTPNGLQGRRLSWLLVKHVKEREEEILWGKVCRSTSELVLQTST